MVKNHSDSEKGNPLLPHWLLLSINSKGSFICTIPQTGYHIPQPLLPPSPLPSLIPVLSLYLYCVHQLLTSSSFYIILVKFLYF